MFNYNNLIDCSNGCIANLIKGTKYCPRCGNTTQLRKNLKCECGKQLSLRDFKEFCTNCGKSMNKSHDENKKKYNS